MFGPFWTGGPLLYPFTSPIRRYPDLQIHRIIKEAIHGELKEKRQAHYEQLLPQVAVQTSALERRAEEAERETEKLKKCEYMAKHIGETFEGVISGVSNWGFYVELPNTVEGMVHISELRDDYYIFDESRYELTGELKKKTYKLGQPVERVDRIRDGPDASNGGFCAGSRSVTISLLHCGPVV